MTGQSSEGSGFKLPNGRVRQPPPVPEPFPSPPPPEAKESFFLGIINILKRIASFVGPTERQIFYEISGMISTYGTAQTLPLSDDSAAYIREQVFDRLGMNAPKLNVYNDGPGTWYIRHSHDGHNFSEEFPMYEGEAKTYENIYELRHRAPLDALKYRITEFDLWKQKNVDYKAGHQYMVNGSVAIGAGNVNPAIAYLTATTLNFNAALTENATTGYIKNRDVLNTLYIWRSRDGINYAPLGVGIGTEYITIDPNGAVNIDYYNIHSIKVSSNTPIATVPYEVWVG